MTFQSSCNSKAESLDKVRQITNKEITFYQVDVTEEAEVDAVIHFAGLKAGG